MYFAQACIVEHAPTGRFHPIYFRYAPMPGGGMEGPDARYKSGGHHTEGFDTHADALNHLVDLEEALVEKYGSSCRCPDFKIVDDNFDTVRILPKKGPDEASREDVVPEAEK